jgi:hypothetical protein
MATGSYVANKPNYTDAQFLQSAIWNGSSWHLVGIFSPRTDAHQLDPGFSPGGEHPTAGLSQLACVSESFCLVAGSWTNGAFVEQWSGIRWSEVSVPDEPGYPKSDSELSGVACVSTDFCFVGGGYPIANGIWRPLVDEWDGHSWMRVTMPKNFHGVNYVGGIRMNAITCASSRRCVSFTDIPMPEADTAVIWNGTGWRYEEVRDQTEGAIVCLAPRSCD